MSSDIVFEARQNVDNRYLLCRLTAATVRQRHHVSANTRDAIVDAFVAICSGLYCDRTASRDTGPAMPSGYCTALPQSRHTVVLTASSQVQIESEEWLK